MKNVYEAHDSTSEAVYCYIARTENFRPLKPIGNLLSLILHVEQDVELLNRCLFVFAWTGFLNKHLGIPQG